MSTMKSAQTVYYGPSTSTYPSVGSVSAGESVTVLWKDCAGWYHIQYSVSGTSKYKRGYVPSSTVTVSGTVVDLISTVAENSKFSCTANTTSSTYTTYTGPSSTTYTEAGSISSGERVTYLYRTNGYTFIEYSISGGKKKRAYTANGNVTIAQ